MSVGAVEPVAAPRLEPGRPASVMGRVTEYRVLLALAFALYVAVYGSMLATTGGLPYVIDNNESFSSLWHAHNLYHFDIRQSMGLTDEASSPHAAAHPFVHSHQGNFPRLFAFVIFVLGARTIESQIVVTTFTIGLLAHYFQFRLFSLISGPRFAFVAAVVFTTDYLFYAQWQVVTYRVWHGFFLFASLLCAHGAMRSRRPRRWLVATALIYLGLFYYELIFVAFVSLFTAFYAAVLGWRMPRRVVVFGAVQGLAGLTSLTILFLQLALYLGWDGLRDDLYLTYVARNFATETADLSHLSPWSMHDVLAMIGGITSIDPSLREQLERFYDRHNLVFWWNLADSRPLRQPGFFAATLFIWVFQLYTPLFTLVTGTVLTGWLLAGNGWWRTPASSVDSVRWHVGGRTAWHWLEVRGSVTVQGERRYADVASGFTGGVARSEADAALEASARTRLAAVRSVLALALLGAAACALVATLLRDDAYRGWPLSRASFLGQIGVLPMLGLVGVVLGGVALVAWWVARSWTVLGGLPTRRFVLAATLLLGLTLFVRAQAGFYDQEYAPVWDGMISAALPGWLGRGAVLAAAALAVALIVAGRRALLRDAQTIALERVAPYLVCGGLAYGLVYYLAAGYVLTGYLLRFGPLVVFVVGPLIALAVAICASMAWSAVRQVFARLGSGTDAGDAPARAAACSITARRGALLAGGVAAASLVFLAGYWTHTQLAYIAAFPPDRFTFLRMFAEPPYRGASFVANTYAAPLSYFTHQWAYFDPAISNGQVHLEQGRIRLVQDSRTYLWYADRHTNEQYAFPEYYACITSPSLRGVLQQQIGQEPRTGRCSVVAIVQRAQSPDQEYLRFSLVARDESSADAWAVVRLNWEQLPYLRPVPTTDSSVRVLATVDEVDGSRTVEVRYEYVDPYQHPERGTLVRLYDVTDGVEARRLLAEVQDSRRVDVPAGFRGTLQASVTPSTGERVGPEYFSQPLEALPWQP